MLIEPIWYWLVASEHYKKISIILINFWAQLWTRTFEPKRELVRALVKWANEQRKQTFNKSSDDWNKFPSLRQKLPKGARGEGGSVVSNTAWVDQIKTILITLLANLGSHYWSVLITCQQHQVFLSAATAKDQGITWVVVLVVLAVLVLVVHLLVQFLI